MERPFEDVPFNKANIQQSEDHSDRFLALATYSTSVDFGGENITLRDRQVEQTYFGDSLLNWLPTHYQEYSGDAFEYDLNSLGLRATLHRDENASLHVEGANFKGSGTRINPGIAGISQTTNRAVDYYHYYAKAQTWSQTLENLPYAHLEAQLAQPKSPLSIAGMTGEKAWLHGRLGAVSGNGSLGGNNAKLFWHWGNNPNQEVNMLSSSLSGLNQDWEGLVDSPILGEAKNGPGFMRFPLIKGYNDSQWDNNTLKFREYTGNDQDILGTVYVISENPMQWQNWYRLHSRQAFVPSSGEELSFVESFGDTDFLGQDEQKRDRYWLGARRSGNQWVSLNPSQTDLHLDWAQGGDPPSDSKFDGLYDFSQSKYVQLMTNRNIPVIKSTGLDNANISSGELKMVPINIQSQRRRWFNTSYYTGSLWSNSNRSVRRNNFTRTYLSSGLGDLSALYSHTGGTTIQLASGGWPETRDNDEMIYWESATGADPHEGLKGWDISDVSSHYYWVKDNNNNRTLNQAREKAKDQGGDLASMHPRGWTSAKFGHYMMTKVTKETIVPYWYHYRKLRSSCNWWRCRYYWTYHKQKRYRSESEFTNTWSGLLKNESANLPNNGLVNITAFVDGSKIAASNGTISSPNYRPYWMPLHHNGWAPTGFGAGTIYTRIGATPVMVDVGTNFETNSYTLETYNYGGLESAYAILEKEIPTDIALAVGQAKLQSSNTSDPLGAILEMPFERTPDLPGFTPVGEGLNAWFYVSDNKFDFLDARLAAQQVGGELISLEEDGAEAALKRWKGRAWIGLYQDTTAEAYDEPFNAWKWLSGGAINGIPWGDGEPNNGVEENSDATPVDEHHAYITTTAQQTGHVIDGSEFNALKVLVSVPKSKAPRIQLAYRATALSENGAAYLEQAYQLNAEGQLLIASEAPSGTSDVNTGIEYVKAKVFTEEANDQLELWLEYDPDGDELPSEETSTWAQLLAPGSSIPGGESTLEFGLGKAYDIDLTAAFEDINARRYWRLWAFDSEIGHRWELKQFDIFFNAPKVINIEAAPSVLIGSDAAGNSFSGVTLSNIDLAVKNVNTGAVLDALHPTSQFNLYTPGNQEPILFDLGDLQTVIGNLSGEALNGTWEVTLFQARDADTGSPLDNMAMHAFTMGLLIPPGMATGPVQHLTDEGDVQFVSNRIRLGGGAPLPTTTYAEDDILTAAISLDPSYEEGVNEEHIHTLTEQNNVVALLPQNPFLEVGIEAEIAVELDGFGTVKFTYQTRDENTLYYVSTTAMEYSFAQRAAAMAGGHLVVPSNPEEAEFTRLQGVHGWSGLIDADTNAVWVPITGEYLDPSWDLMAEFSAPPLHSDDLVSSDDTHSTLGADGLQGQGAEATAPATLEIGKEGSPGLTWAAITEDQLFYDIYDPASDRHYIGARIGDAQVLDGQQLLGSQGRIWRASDEGRILGFSNADSDAPQTPVAPTIDGFSLVSQTDSSDYFVSVDGNLNYLQAQAACDAKGGRLASFETEAENSLVQNTAQGHIGLWKSGEGSWAWNNGSALTYDAPWSAGDVENPASDVAVVLTDAGWDRKSAISVSHAICEFPALEEFEAGTTAFMVPSSTNTFPIHYESNSSFTLPTILLLDSAGLQAMDGPAHFGEDGWMLNSQTRRRTPAWEVPVLLAPDPIGINELTDASHGIYTAQTSTDGTMGSVQQEFATYNLGNIQLKNLWNTSSAAENGTPLTLVDAAVHPDSLGGLDNLLADYNAGEFHLTPPPANHGLWREGSDVKVFNANTLKTSIDLSPTGDFNDHKIHVAFPISAPKFNHETLADLSYSGADAVNNGLPYWGIPNGVPAYAEMYVRVRNELTGALFDTVLTTLQEPLLLKNCPHIMNDSIYMDIKVGQMNNSDGQLKFTGGDPVVISASVLWMTEGRRTMLWSDRDIEHNTLTMCTDISPSFALQEDPQEQQHLIEVDHVLTDADGNELTYTATDSIGLSTVTLVWNHNQSMYSSGGSMYLQRRNYEDYGGTILGWEYATGDASKPWSHDQAEAKPFYNVDADFNGNLDPIFYTDSTLYHNIWSCETAEYRVKQDMCGDEFHTPTIQVSIQGSVSDPWKYVDELNEGVFVSQGRYPYKVRIEWSEAVDDEGLIDQFRLYRRLYQPAEPNDDAWEQIFSSEDITWFIDQDLAAGSLYEYRVGSVITCGTGNAVQQYYNPTPYPIGFRSNYGGVEGRITFENGAPEDSVHVVVEPQGLNLARNSMLLEEGEYAKFDIRLDEMREEGDLNHWPDIHSDHFHPTLSFVDSTGLRVSEGVSVSQWVKVPKATLLGHPVTGAGAAEEAPLFTLNYHDPLANLEKESLSIWARKINGNDGQYRLSARQSGVFTDFGAFELDYDKFQHLTFTMANVESGREVPGIRIYVRAHGDDPGVIEQPVEFYDFRGPDDVIQMIRENWSAWIWNAATGTSGFCSDPNALNFAGNELGGSLEYCDYEMPSGCTDPQGQNYLEYALFEPGGGEDACNYSYYGTGEEIALHWFSDDDANPYEYPVILRLEGDGSETVVKSFWSDLNRYQDSLQVLGMLYPYSSVVMSVKLPNGDYRMRVLDSREEGDGSLPHMEADSFSGNFALYNSVGVNHVTCSQYIQDEANGGSYDLSIITHSALASGVGQIDNFLLVDCAECFSVNFLNNATIEMPLTAKGQDAIEGASTYEFWWRTADVIDGETYLFGDIFTIEGDDSSGDITLRVVEDTEDPSNMGNAKWELTGPAGTMRRIPEQPTYNEYAVIPGQWYHVTLAVGQPTGDGQPMAYFTMRSTDQNLADNEPWNNPRHFEFDNLDDDGNPLDLSAQFVIAPVDPSANYNAEKIILGGSNVLIHRLSIWEGILTPGESASLFEGADLRGSTFNATVMPNETGVWVQPDGGDLPFSRLRSVLVPDNAGRFVDQMLDKQLQPQGTNFDANPISEAYFVGSEVATGAGALTVDGTTGADELPSINRKSIRRAPYGQCNPGCNRLFDACNFNPFANQFIDCELSCTGEGLRMAKMAAEAIVYDEIRAWGNAPFYAYAEGSRVVPGAPLYGQDYRSWEAAKFWMQRYPSNFTEGMLLMYDADEGLGNALYDRAKYTVDNESWMGHNAALYHQTFALSSSADTSWYQIPDPTRNYFANGPLRDLPQSLGSWAYTNINSGGGYVIGNVKFVGSGDFFDIKPSKSTSGFEHIFEPAQRTTIIGDVLLLSEDQDFIDKSSFEVEVRVTYQDLPAGQTDYANVTSPGSSYCPVANVSFKVDGSVAMDDESQAIKTDQYGFAKLSIPRGEHLIEPILKDNDEDNDEDNHVFASTSTSGRQVFITGPVLRDSDGNLPSDVQFVDITKRRAIGRIVTGDAMGAAAWDASANNLGLTSFTLLPIDKVENQNTWTQAFGCPALKITTDTTTGQYEFYGLPKDYRIAISSDTILIPSVFDACGGFEHLDVQGWKRELPATSSTGRAWSAGFSNYMKATSEGDYNPFKADYAVWNLSLLPQEWSHNSEYPSHPIAEGTSAMPANFAENSNSRVFDRQDLIYNPAIELIVNQIQTDGSQECNPEAPALAYPILEQTFLGETELYHTDGEAKYFLDAERYLAAYKFAQDDKEENALDGVAPFPLGLPVLHSHVKYCMSIYGSRQSYTEIPHPTIQDSISYAFGDTTKVKGDQYSLTITNSLAKGDNVVTQTLSEDSLIYSFSCKEPNEYNTNDQGVHVPTGNMSMVMSAYGITVDIWDPFAHLIPQEADLEEVPGLLRHWSDQELLFQRNRFDAIIFGDYAASDPVPVSSDAILDFILRDPPGDASYCTLEQGSIMSMSKSISTSEMAGMDRKKNSDVSAKKNDEGGLVLAPLGIGMQQSSATEFQAGLNTSQTEEYTKDKFGEVSIEESLEFNQAITTSGISHKEQDLFYGEVRNTSMSNHRIFGINPTQSVINASLGQNVASEMGIPFNDEQGAPQAVFADGDGDGILDEIMMMKLDDNGNVTGEVTPFVMNWSGRVKQAILPASHFMKTQYTIENVDIPMLMTARDAYFSNHPELYTWPDGTPSNVQYNQLGWKYPYRVIWSGDATDEPDTVWTDMKLANNDDHRWETFYSAWLSSVGQGIPNKASTITKGYNVPSAIQSLVDLSSDILDGDLPTELQLAGVPHDVTARLLTDKFIGDDRIGPGYRFLAADITLDSVRFFNNQIAQWSKILAQNEFEKINARRFIFDNIGSYSEIDQLSDWSEDLQTSGATAAQFSLDDFTSSTSDLEAFDPDAIDIWSSADFEPFFLTFSGGGAEFTQSITKTNIQTTENAVELSFLSQGSLNVEVYCSGQGFNQGGGDLKQITEVRENSETNESSMTFSYTLSDDDFQDFYLVAVIPGAGANGPIFLNLGGASSCKYRDADISQYSEWFPALIPSSNTVSGSLLDCNNATLAEPVWSRTIDTNKVIMDPVSGGTWHAMDPGQIEANTATLAGGPSDAILAIQGGIFAVQIAYNIVKQNYAGAAQVGIAAAAWGAFLAADAGITYGFRQLVSSEYGGAFAGEGFSDANVLAIEDAVEADDVFIADGMCADIFEKDAYFEVQPATVQLQVPNITVSYDAPGGNSVSDATEVSATAFMDQSIGMTLHLRNNAPNPIGGYANFLIFSDVTLNTLGAEVTIGGTDGNAGAFGYTIEPSWSSSAPLGGAYDVPVVFEHSGVDNPDFQNGSVQIIMESECDNFISDAVKVNLNFEPACSDVTMLQPLENWTANLDRITNGSTEHPSDLSINVDVSKNHFTNWVQPNSSIDYISGEGPVVVEYRLGNGSIWSPISNSLAFGTDSTVILNEDGSLNDVTLSWKPIIAEQLCNPLTSADGTSCLGYEGEVLLRSRSVCADPFALPKTSEVISGYVDYVRPELFGSVLPSDGFLEPGDELQLRWSEGMETSNPAFTLSPDSIKIRATQNSDYTKNSGGVKFTEDEHLTVVQGPHLDAYYVDEDMIGFPGWSVSWKQWGGGLYGVQDTASGTIGATSADPDALIVAPNQITVVVPPSNASGVVFTQGDQSGYSLTGEFVDIDHFKLTSTVPNVGTSSYTVQISGANAQWNGLWNQLELVFEPTATEGSYNWRLDLNGAPAGQNGVISNINLEPTRLTLGNGWINGHPTGDPLSMPMQDFRMWNSQRETYASETPAFQITGNEIGLQLWLPMDELEGTPADRARMRDVIMEANWYSPGASHALDFASNTNGSLIPSISGVNWTPDGTRNTTLEFWVKPGGLNEGIMSINGTADPDIDLRRVGWSGFIDEAGRLGFANGTDTMRTQVPLSQSWHHVALVRRYNGTALLYVDGEEVAGDPAYDHGKLIPVVLHLGARNQLPSGIGECHDLQGISFNTDGDANVHQAGSLGWAMFNGVPAEFFGDGTVATDDLDYANAFHPSEQACIDACVDAPPSGAPVGYDRFFTGKLDELRVWNTALTKETIVKQMRDGVYGYENLVLHVPFETGIVADTLAVHPYDAYVYAPYDGFDYFNDASSMLTTHGYNAVELGNIGNGGLTAIISGIQEEDAPLMQSAPQTTLSAVGDIMDVSWNSLHDECIIELNEQSLYKYEDQLVTFVIPKTQLRDEAGNATESDLVFEMLIDRNPLKWSETEAQVEHEFDMETVSYTTEIMNVGNTTKYFEVSGLPAWIEASPSSGNIPANSTMEITFSAPEALPIGYFEFDARLKGGLPCGNASSGGFCYAERFTLGVDIFATPPELEIDVAAFEYIMPLVTKAYINNAASTDEDDIVMAYIDGELRGYSNLDLPVAGQNLAFVSVFYDTEDIGKEIEFNIWDASKGMTRAQVSTHWPTLEQQVEVTPNENGIGNLFEPLLLKATSRVAINTKLVPGWNWISVNVVDTPATFSLEQAFEHVPSEDILQVKSHLTPYKLPSDVDHGWTPYAGDETDVQMRYMVQMKADTPDEIWTMTNIGFTPNPTEEEFLKPLVYGWNELGYLPQQSFNVDQAMRSVSDADSILGFNDLIQSRHDGFAMYAGDGNWIGSLNTMRPGQGYRMRLGLTSAENVGQPAGTLEWPLSLGMEYLVRSDEEETTWPMEVLEWESSMLGVIRLEVPSSQPQSLIDALGAFVDGPQGPICIGQARPMDTDQGLLYFLTAFGEANAALFAGDVHFRWMSGLTELEFTADETVAFEADRLHGDLESPMLLHFREALAMPETSVNEHLVAFPNPFRNELSIHWHGDEEVLELRVEDASGKTIDVLDCKGIAEGPCRWVTNNLASGVYFIHAITESGHHAVRVIK